MDDSFGPARRVLYRADSWHGAQHGRRSRLDFQHWKIEGATLRQKHQCQCHFQGCGGLGRSQGGDYGSAAIMAALYALVFISVPSTKKDKFVTWTKRIACIGLIVCVLILKFGYLVIPQKVLESDYRLNRLVYKSPCDRYEDNSGYQVCNGYIAIDNGGMSGVGIGESVQKYLYLPASHTDFIFPIVVEELGTITGVLIIIGYMVIIFLVFKVAIECENLQNSIICYGIAIYFMLHIFVNLGGVLGIIPLTGVPLPFLSYGGSFCITVICSFAIVQRINMENLEEKRIKELKGEAHE